ncbi:MAG: lysophospholipid acyltransferase family protein [Aureispira sp.]|nr:lysophospholipid acyltransferase family protein [Aureispira sp.]
MQRFVYYLFRIFVGLFQFLPFWLLYAFSSGIYFLLYHVLRYRRKVVWDNLSKSFPEKSEQELTSISKEFYKHLTDLLVESLKGFSISEKAFLSRFSIKNTEVLTPYHQNNQSVIGLLGHYGNWEWGAMGAPFFFQQKIVAIYTPIKNPYINNYIKKSRERFGALLCSTRDSAKALKNHKEGNSFFLLAADQNPSNAKRAHWVDFLGRDTATLRSTRFAQMHDLPLIFVTIAKIKRGKYLVDFKKITDSPNDYTDLELTQLFMSHLEQRIREKPAYWLWSHKRWKHSRTKETSQ